MTTGTTPQSHYRIKDFDLMLSEAEPRNSSNNYVLRVRDLPDADKPRERLLESGPGNLSVAELLAIVWGVGTRSEDVLAMARRTLKEYGQKAVGNELNARRLAETADIPLVKATQVVASFELGRRFYASQSGRSVHIRNAKQAYQYFKPMGLSQKEQLRGLYLNSRYRIVHDEVISVGSLTASIVHPREVFQPAIERGAVAVILAHNHPSGRLEPTLADVQVTEQLISAGQVLGIELLDHLIVTDSKYVSILEEFIGNER